MDIVDADGINLVANIAAVAAYSFEHNVLLENLMAPIVSLNDNIRQILIFDHSGELLFSYKNKQDDSFDQHLFEQIIVSGINEINAYDDEQTIHFSGNNDEFEVHGKVILYLHTLSISYDIYWLYLIEIITCLILSIFLYYIYDYKKVDRENTTSNKDIVASVYRDLIKIEDSLIIQEKKYNEKNISRQIIYEGIFQVVSKYKKSNPFDYKIIDQYITELEELNNKTFNESIYFGEGEKITVEECIHDIQNYLEEESIKTEINEFNKKILCSFRLSRIVAHIIKIYTNKDMSGTVTVTNRYLNSTTWFLDIHLTSDKNYESSESASIIEEINNNSLIQSVLDATGAKLHVNTNGVGGIYVAIENTIIATYKVLVITKRKSYFQGVLGSKLISTEYQYDINNLSDEYDAIIVDFNGIDFPEYVKQFKMFRFKTTVAMIGFCDQDLLFNDSTELFDQVVRNKISSSEIVDVIAAKRDVKLILSKYGSKTTEMA